MNKPKGIFAGRLNRLGYLMANVYWGLLATALCILALVAIKYIPNSAAVSIVSMVVIIGCLVALEVVAIGFAIRRLHDINQSGWLVLLLFVPILSYVFAVMLYVVPGTSGPNPFGDGPQASLGFRDVSGL